MFFFYDNKKDSFIFLDQSWIKKTPQDIKSKAVVFIFYIKLYCLIILQLLNWSFNLKIVEDKSITKTFLQSWTAVIEKLAWQNI